MSRSVITGSVDQSIQFWAFDSDGAAVIGEAYNSAGMAVSVVVRSDGRILSTTALTLVARSGVGVHTDSALTEVGGGEYVVDLPDIYSATANRDISITVAATAITGTVIVQTLVVGQHAELDSATQQTINDTHDLVAYLSMTGVGVSGSGTDIVFTMSGTFSTGQFEGWILRLMDGCTHRIATTSIEVISTISTVTATLETELLVDLEGNEEITLYPDVACASGGSGTATLEKQEEILAAIQGTEVIQVASPNVLGNLVLTQGDHYDGIANPKASWTVTTDYTDGWSVVFTIRDSDDAVIYTTAGTVVSATVIAVTIAAPTGLTMDGCPGQWQGKFDVQLTKNGSNKTIALGTCYINEDQTR